MKQETPITKSNLPEEELDQIMKFIADIIIDSYLLKKRVEKENTKNGNMWKENSISNKNTCL